MTDEGSSSPSASSEPAVPAHDGKATPDNSSTTTMPPPTVVEPVDRRGEVIVVIREDEASSHDAEAPQHITMKKQQEGDDSNDDTAEGEASSAAVAPLPAPGGEDEDADYRLAVALQNQIDAEASARLTATKVRPGTSTSAVGLQTGWSCPRADPSSSSRHRGMVSDALHDSGLTACLSNGDHRGGGDDDPEKPIVETGVVESDDAQPHQHQPPLCNPAMEALLAERGLSNDLSPRSQQRAMAICNPAMEALLAEKRPQTTGNCDDSSSRVVMNGDASEESSPATATMSMNSAMEALPAQISNGVGNVVADESRQKLLPSSSDVSAEQNAHADAANAEAAHQDLDPAEQFQQGRKKHVNNLNVESNCNPAMEALLAEKQRQMDGKSDGGSSPILLVSKRTVPSEEFATEEEATAAVAAANTAGVGTDSVTGTESVVGNETAISRGTVASTTELERTGMAAPANPEAPAHCNPAMKALLSQQQRQKLVQNGDSEREEREGLRAAVQESTIQSETAALLRASQQRRQPQMIRRNNPRSGRGQQQRQGGGAAGRWAAGAKNWLERKREERRQRMLQREIERQKQRLLEGDDDDDWEDRPPEVMPERMRVDVEDEVGGVKNRDWGEAMSTTATTSEAVPPPILVRPAMERLAARHLPASLQLRRWRRVYSLLRDGDSFETFLQNTARYDKTVLVVKTTREEVFGGYVDSPWDMRQKSGGVGGVVNPSLTSGTFHGSAQAFLFKIVPKDCRSLEERIDGSGTGTSTDAKVDGTSLEDSSVTETKEDARIDSDVRDSSTQEAADHPTEEEVQSRDANKEAAKKEGSTSDSTVAKSCTLCSDSASSGSAEGTNPKGGGVDSTLNNGIHGDHVEAEAAPTGAPHEVTAASTAPKADPVNSGFIREEQICPSDGTGTAERCEAAPNSQSVTLLFEASSDGKEQTVVSTDAVGKDSAELVGSKDSTDSQASTVQSTAPAEGSPCGSDRTSSGFVADVASGSQPVSNHHVGNEELTGDDISNRGEISEEEICFYDDLPAQHDPAGKGAENERYETTVVSSSEVGKQVSPEGHEGTVDKPCPDILTPSQLSEPPFPHQQTKTDAPTEEVGKPTCSVPKATKEIAADADTDTDVDEADDVDVIAYKWTGRNHYIQLCDVANHKIAMGGGGSSASFGLVLEQDFSKGSTGPCDTFGNEPLCGVQLRKIATDVEGARMNGNGTISPSGSFDEGWGSESTRTGPKPFDILDVEVWGFVSFAY